MRRTVHRDDANPDARNEAPDRPTSYLDPASIAVSGDGNPQFSLDAGATWQTSCTIEPGQSVRLRMTSAATSDGIHQAELAIGEREVAWNVTTRTIEFEAVYETMALANPGAETGDISGWTPPATQPSP